VIQSESVEKVVAISTSGQQLDQRAHGLTTLEIITHKTQAT